MFWTYTISKSLSYMEKSLNVSEEFIWIALLFCYLVKQGFPCVKVKLYDKYKSRCNDKLQGNETMNHNANKLIDSNQMLTTL